MRIKGIPTLTVRVHSFIRFQKILTLYWVTIEEKVATPDVVSKIRVAMRIVPLT